MNKEEEEEEEEEEKGRGGEKGATAIATKKINAYVLNGQASAEPHLDLSVRLSLLHLTGCEGGGKSRAP